MTSGLSSNTPVNANILGIQGCVGYSDSVPHVVIHTTSSYNPLRFFFIGNSGDTTLIIRSPSGSWHCGDDSLGTSHPSVDFSNSRSGDYYVWVGSFSPQDRIQGTLYVTRDTNVNVTNPRGTVVSTPRPANPPASTGLSLVRPSSYDAALNLDYSVWSGLDFQTPTSPRTADYYQTISQNQGQTRWMIYWCGDTTQELQQFMGAVDMSFYVDNQRVTDSQLLSLDYQNGYCHAWITVVNRWVTGDYTLDIRYSLRSTVSLGGVTMSSGNYVQRIHATVR